MAERENYSGSVELISGLKPKNNGDFPLLHAHDIQVDADGTRLDEKLSTMSTDDSTGDSGVSIAPSVVNEFKLRYQFYYYTDFYDALADLVYGSPANGLTVEIENAVCAIYFDEVKERNVLVLLEDVTAPTEDIEFNHPMEINFAGKTLTFDTCGNSWTFNEDVYLNGTYGGGVEAIVSVNDAVHPLYFQGAGSLVVDGGLYLMHGGANHATSSACLLYTKNTMASVTIKNAVFEVNYQGTAKCYAVVCNTQKNHVENVIISVEGVENVVAVGLYGMQISSTGGAKATVCNCEIRVQARAIGTRVFGIFANKQAVATFKDNTIIADAGNNGTERDGFAVGLHVDDECGEVFVSGGYYAGTHSGMGASSVVIVDGGKFVSCSHGGIYFAHPNKTSYIKNATLGIEYTGIFDTASMENPIPFAPFYIGGSTGNDNITVHMDNCTFLCTDNTAWGGGVVRGTSGEKNGRLYISNTIIPDGHKLRVDNDNFVFVGAGTNISENNVVAGSAAVIQTVADDAVTYVGNRTYTRENEYTNEKIDEVEVIEGEQGESGATFTPSVSSAGVLSWTNDKGLENPDSVNIKGPQGEQGEKGDKGDTGAAGAAGADGKDGYTPVKGTDYFTEADKQEIVSAVLANFTDVSEVAL